MQIKHLVSGLQDHRHRFWLEFKNAKMSSNRKKVSVTFAGADDVLQHIIPNEKIASLRPRRSIGSGTPKKVSITANVDVGEDYDENEEVFRPSEALVEDEDITGSDVYGFKGNKRRDQMANKASETALALTPKSKSGSRTPSSKTPRSILKKSTGSISADVPGTPKGRRGKKKKIEATTPHRLRARNRQAADSDSDESVSSASDGELSDTEGKENTRTPSGRRKRRAVEEDNLPANVDNYFDCQGGPTMTSDHTLARLETPRMDHEALTAALSGLEMNYKKERKMLYNEYKAMFNLWMFQLCHGYNLLFHGLGSKRKLVEEFRKNMLQDLTHVVVNGYFPSITIKSILNTITEDVLEHSGNFRSPMDQCEFIRQHFEEEDPQDFYLLINNIDGSMLRGEKVQMVLSHLAQIRGFHIIASIDHINAPLIWDQNKACRFNWLWYDVTTYEAYSEETSYENSLLVQQSGALALSSMTHIMRSLTPNAKGIFFLLARYQLENKDNQNYQGLAFPDLYQKCREAFLVNSDLTLRTQLIEFRDHKLLRSKKIDGMEYLLIPLDNATLKEFMEQQEDH